MGKKLSDLELAKKQKKQAATVKKEPKYTPKGRIYLTATFNNTLVTITDDTGHSRWTSRHHRVRGAQRRC